MSGERVFVVDRLENGHAVVIGDDGSEFVLARNELPSGTGEGTVLRVRVSGDRPEWKAAIIDTAEQSRRLEDVKRRMDALRKQDPGGDLEL